MRIYVVFVGADPCVCPADHCNPAGGHMGPPLQITCYCTGRASKNIFIGGFRTHERLKTKVSVDNEVVG